MKIFWLLILSLITAFLSTAEAQTCRNTYPPTPTAKYDQHGNVVGAGNYTYPWALVWESHWACMYPEYRDQRSSLVLWRKYCKFNSWGERHILVAYEEAVPRGRIWTKRIKARLGDCSLRQRRALEKALQRRGSEMR